MKIFFTCIFIIISQCLVFSQNKLALVYLPNVGDTLVYSVDTKIESELSKSANNRINYKVFVVCTKTDSLTYFFRLNAKLNKIESLYSMNLVLDYCMVLALSKVNLLFTNSFGTNNIALNPDEVKKKILAEMIKYENQYLSKNDKMEKAELLRVRSSNLIDQKIKDLMTSLFQFAGHEFETGYKEVINHTTPSTYSNEKVPVTIEFIIGKPDTLNKSLTFTERTSFNQKDLQRVWAKQASYFSVQLGKKFNAFSDPSKYDQFQERTYKYNYDKGILLKATQIEGNKIAGLNTVKTTMITLLK